MHRIMNDAKGTGRLSSSATAKQDGGLPEGVGENITITNSTIEATGGDNRGNAVGIAITRVPIESAASHTVGGGCFLRHRRRPRSR